LSATAVESARQFAKGSRRTLKAARRAARKTDAGAAATSFDGGAPTAGDDSDGGDGHMDKYDEGSSLNEERSESDSACDADRAFEDKLNAAHQEHLKAK